MVRCPSSFESLKVVMLTPVIGRRYCTIMICQCLMLLSNNVQQYAVSISHISGLGAYARRLEATSYLHQDQNCQCFPDRSLRGPGTPLLVWTYGNTWI